MFFMAFVWDGVIESFKTPQKCKMRKKTLLGGTTPTKINCF